MRGEPWSLPCPSRNSPKRRGGGVGPQAVALSPWSAPDWSKDPTTREGLITFSQCLAGCGAFIVGLWGTQVKYLL
jgi:hypothetical protein